MNCFNIRQSKIDSDSILLQIGIPTAFTAGGNKEADMATPTSEAVYSPKTARATPAPLGIATKTPTQRERISHLLKKNN